MIAGRRVVVIASGVLDDATLEALGVCVIHTDDAVATVRALLQRSPEADPEPPSWAELQIEAAIMSIPINRRGR